MNIAVFSSFIEWKLLLYPKFRKTLPDQIRLGSVIILCKPVDMACFVSNPA